MAEDPPENPKHKLGRRQFIPLALASGAGILGLATVAALPRLQQETRKSDSELAHALDRLKSSHPKTIREAVLLAADVAKSAKEESLPQHMEQIFISVGELTSPTRRESYFFNWEKKNDGTLNGTYQTPSGPGGLVSRQDNENPEVRIRGGLATPQTRVEVREIGPVKKDDDIWLREIRHTYFTQDRGVMLEKQLTVVSFGDTDTSGKLLLGTEIWRTREWENGVYRGEYYKHIGIDFVTGEPVDETVWFDENGQALSFDPESNDLVLSTDPDPMRIPRVFEAIDNTINP